MIDGIVPAYDKAESTMMEHWCRRHLSQQKAQLASDRRGYQDHQYYKKNAVFIIVSGRERAWKLGGVVCTLRKSRTRSRTWIFC